MSQVGFGHIANNCSESMLVSQSKQNLKGKSSKCMSSVSNSFVVLQLVEAKLKRAYQEGQAARAAGQDPLAAELAACTHRLRAQSPTLASPITLLQEDVAPVHDPAPSQADPELGSGQEQQAAAAAKTATTAGATEQELSVAQADANMAALLQEEAG